MYFCALIFSSVYTEIMSRLVLNKTNNNSKKCVIHSLYDNNNIIFLHNIIILQVRRTDRGDRYKPRPKNVNGSPYQFFRPNRIKYQIDRPIYII